MTRHRRVIRPLLALIAATLSAVALVGPAATASAAAPRGTAGGDVQGNLPGALHTQGRWIVDRGGDRVKLASVNWSGAETQAYTVGGLDERPLDRLAALIHRGGFNAVRLPWSNQLVEDNPVVPAQYLSANPQLQGMHALSVLDAVINALGRHDVMVVLDNHRSRADWCCDEQHGDGLWYTPQYPESSWIADWKFMAQRYAHTANVVGAELRNEIRPEPQLAPGPTTATWGDGNSLTDWRAAAERGGDAVLSVDPNWLIVVGGTEYQGNLTGVRTAPVQLSVPHRVVYAAHDYRWFESNAELNDYSAFKAKLDQRWGYVATPNQSWTAPIYVSETGTCTNPNVTEQCDPTDPTYLRDIHRYLAENDFDFAYWPFNGTQGTGYNRTYGQPETYGLLAPDWSGYGNTQVLSVIQSLQRPQRGPGV
ncbi:MAG TPA: cellulase family glycosylhydrolase [Jatrophihabitans sp.]|jgi:endoglucanase